MLTLIRKFVIGHLNTNSTTSYFLYEYKNRSFKFHHTKSMVETHDTNFDGEHGIVMILCKGILYVQGSPHFDIEVLDFTEDLEDLYLMLKCGPTIKDNNILGASKNLYLRHNKRHLEEYLKAVN